MKPYRCMNSACATDPRGGFDFVAEAPRKGQAVACPKCGCTNADHHDLIVPLEVIHFDPPHPKLRAIPPHVTNKGTGFRACSKTTPINQANGRGTGSPQCVTCPQCLATEEFRKAADEIGEPELVPAGLENAETVIHNALADAAAALEG